MKVAFSNKSDISMAIVTRSDNYWELFWSTLISAVVENEAPDEVVLTFGLTNTSLTKDDFSIEGFTISSLSRDTTNKILTLTLTEDFDSDTEAEITFGKTGESYSITNNVTAFDWDAYWVTLKSGLIWYRREINSVIGYFALHYSDNGGATWDTLFTLDLTEDSVVIDLTHIYRHRIVGTSYHVDRTLTPLGYSGIEDTDWENIYST